MLAKNTHDKYRKYRKNNKCNKIPDLERKEAKILDLEKEEIKRGPEMPANIAKVTRIFLANLKHP